jgi:hypothetical protein
MIFLFFKPSFKFDFQESRTYLQDLLSSDGTQSQILEKTFAFSSVARIIYLKPLETSIFYHLSFGFKMKPHKGPLKLSVEETVGSEKLNL